MEINELDLLYFLRDQNKSNFNKNFTPLEKQGHIYRMSSIMNKKEKLSENSKLNSRRVLNFDSALSEFRNSRSPSNTTSIKQSVSKSANLGKHLMNLKNMTQSPYQMKKFALATPLTAAMEMYNWLFDKVQKKNFFKDQNIDWNALKRNQEIGNFINDFGEENFEIFFKTNILKISEKIVKEELKNVNNFIFLSNCSQKDLK